LSVNLEVILSVVPGSKWEGCGAFRLGADNGAFCDGMSRSRILQLNQNGLLHHCVFMHNVF